MHLVQDQVQTQTVMNTEKRGYVEAVWHLTSCNLDPGMMRYMAYFSDIGN